MKAGASVFFVTHRQKNVIHVQLKSFPMRLSLSEIEMEQRVHDSLNNY